MPPPESLADSALQQELFGTARALPAGWRYCAEFLSGAEEAALLAVIGELPLAPARYKGYTARRRVLSFGTHYDFDTHRLDPGPAPLPALLPLRAKAAQWLGIEPEAFVNLLITDYPVGTPLGWHRDAPDFETVVGISLLGPARMRFRPYPPEQPDRRDLLAIELPPRSAYVLSGAARWGWQHSVAPTRARRLSITLRTARRHSAAR